MVDRFLEQQPAKCAALLSPQRYTSVQEKNIVHTASTLDPRIKALPFLSKDEQQDMRSKVIAEAAALEETLSFHVQLSRQVQVDVDAAPSADLNLVIDEIRDQYETLVAKNRRDVEAWFKSKSEAVQQDLKVSTEVLQTTSVELKDSQSSLCNLELELQGLLSMKSALEGSLSDTEAFYSAQMVGLQATVLGLEDQLIKLRADTERLSQDYQTLLNIRIRLEMEIAEYRRLLEGGDIG
ncbi:hypothetical protein SKAU_G00133050 [Synaphobranchus kaupii]|uniref:IF rod domain-containing protein n=1 Tax=Synaphobranchus kaupii TaxID=118154 RepID=A0A9Q1J2I9_SYNKA|nr:hypothetical protein SKAU_G00133050 [Synaphobranchus kaupii]